jgi:hypothetical protein
MSKTIGLCCNCGLGDSLINFIFFYAIKQYIESNDIKIIYKCSKEKIPNLSEFLCSDNITITTLDDEKNDSDYFIWQMNVKKKWKFIEERLCIMFNDFLSHFDIPIHINTYEYCDPDLLVRYKEIEKEKVYTDLDFLVINSIPKSDQFRYDADDFDQFILLLSKKYKIATSKTIHNSNIPSMQHLSVKTIAAISTHAKNIIAINTGPSIPLFNTYTLDNVQKFYILDTCGTVWKTRKVVKCFSIHDLDFLLPSPSTNFLMPTPKNKPKTMKMQI